MVLNYAALSFAVVATLIGVEQIRRRVEGLEAAATKALTRASSQRPFREMKSTVAPLFATVVTSCAFAISALIQDGWPAALLRGATWIVLGVPIWTFLWTYASLQLGLARLGQSRLRDEPSVIDPSLALRPFGDAALTGLSLLLVSIVPVLVTGLPDATGFALGLVVLGAGLASFLFSLWGLHRQVAAVKENRLALARELYAEAYEPLRAERTLEALERQHSLLGAADALEKRARALHAWPVAEGTWAWVIGLATSVVAIACARLILRALGF